MKFPDKIAGVKLRWRNTVKLQNMDLESVQYLTSDNNIMIIINPVLTGSRLSYQVVSGGIIINEIETVEDAIVQAEELLTAQIK